MNEFDEPTKKIVHEVGCDLDALSVAELQGRITLLSREIERLEQNILTKGDSLNAAESFFKS